MTLKDDLIAARALIDTPEKWRRGAYGIGSPCLCASAALMVACGERGDPFEGEAWEAIFDGVPEGYHSIADYNDAPTTAHADIMALFDRAINACEAV